VNVNVSDESQIASGRLFQVRWPATANDPSLNEVWVRGTCSFSLHVSWSHSWTSTGKLPSCYGLVMDLLRNFVSDTANNLVRNKSS